MCLFVAHIPYTIYHEFQFRFGLSFVAYFLSWLIPRYKTPPDATQWQVTTWLTAQHWQNYLKYARNMPRKRGRERAWNYERYRKRERERQAKSLAFEETFLFLGDMPSVGRLTHLAWLVPRISGLSISFESHRSFSSLRFPSWFQVLFRVLPFSAFFFVCRVSYHIILYCKLFANIFTMFVFFDVIYCG